MLKAFPQVLSYSPVTMASTPNKHLQCNEQDASPHQTVDKVDKTQNPTGLTPTPGLLAIPLEIRLQIFGYLLRADEGRVCPHARLPYLFMCTVIRSHSEVSNNIILIRDHCEVPNNIFLPALLINRQLYFEMKPILYSENLIYCQNLLTDNHFIDPPDFHRRLLATIGTNIRQIGFPLDMIRGGSQTKETSIKAKERLITDFQWLSTHLPNLHTTRVDLFPHKYSSPCQGFLVCLARCCRLLPGKKIITVHDTNRGKVRIGNLLRIHLHDCPDILLLGGCICIPFVETTWEHRVIQSYNHMNCMLHISWWRARARLHSYTRPTDKTSLNTLTEWVAGEMSKSSGDKLVYESVVKYGSVLLSYNARVKGPRMGCLLCKLGTNCVHGARYTPTRKAPVDRVGKVSIGAFEDWVDGEVTRQSTVGSVNFSTNLSSKMSN